MEPRVWHASYDPGVIPDVPFRNVPVTRFLADSAARFPEARALILGDAAVTYGQLQGTVKRLAGALTTLGAGPGTRIAIRLPNLPETVYAYYAALLVGAKVVMTNPICSDRELAHQWSDAGCSIAVVTDTAYQLLRSQPTLPIETYIVVRTTSAPLPPAEPGLRLMSDLMLSDAAPPAVALDMSDLAQIQYTSGTSGEAKGAMLSHRNLSAIVQQVAAWFPGARPGVEVVAACLPYFHMFGITACLNYPVYLGAAIVLIPNPRDVTRLVSQLAHHRVTILSAVPRMIQDIGAFDRLADHDFSSLRICVSGSAPLSLTVKETFEQRMGARIAEGYGLTEASPTTHLNPLAGYQQVGSVGIPLPATDAAIVDPGDGRTRLAPGREGELVVKGPQVMMGYWPDGKADNLVDGWLRTGDAASMDHDGYFSIKGRIDDLIVLSSGEKIHPDDVDREIATHPAVAETATIGVPDPHDTDARVKVVKSFVVLHEGQSLSSSALIDYCRLRLSPHQVPREIEFRAQLPRSSMLKVLRRELRTSAR